MSITSEAAPTYFYRARIQFNSESKKISFPEWPLNNEGEPLIAVKYGLGLIHLQLETVPTKETPPAVFATDPVQWISFPEANDQAPTHPSPSSLGFFVQRPPLPSSADQVLIVDCNMGLEPEAYRMLITVAHQDAGGYHLYSSDDPTILNEAGPPNDGGDGD